MSITTDMIVKLDDQQLALWTYIRQFGEDNILHIDNIHQYFPFAKHLFSSDPEDLEQIFTALVAKYHLRIDNIPLTYKRAKEIDSDAIWSYLYNRLIDIDKSFVRNKMYDIIKNIQLYEFLELERSLSDQNFRDPFLTSFSEDQRLGRHGWWQAVCQLANLYDRAAQGRISDLFFKFVEIAALKLPEIEDMDAFSKRIDEKWVNNKIIELEAVVDDVTPWKPEMKTRIILVKWRDISLDRRDQIRDGSLKSLLHDATLAHIILPVGNPSARDEDTLKSTQLTIFTPEDSKNIFIDNDPQVRFRELLREKMDIELLSPYQFTSFVPEVMFFGRSYPLNLIAHHPETNYAIYGSRRSGKTSLMKQLERLYIKQKPVAFVNGEDVSVEEDFFTSLSNALNIKTSRSRMDFEDAAKNIKPGTLILIDEIDNALEKCDPGRILSVLRHLVGQYGVRCVLAGTTELYKQYLDIKSPMYNFADPLPLGPFTELEAINLAREPMLSLGVTYEKGAIKQLINLCGRFPNLIQLMCHELVIEVKREGAGKAITSEMLNKIFGGDTFGGNVYLHFLHNFSPQQKLIVYASMMVKEMSLQMIVERVQKHYNLSLTRIEKLLDELALLFLFDKSGTTYRWVFEGYPTILRKQINSVAFMIEQTIKEIKKETEDK